MADSSIVSPIPTTMTTPVASDDGEAKLSDVEYLRQFPPGYRFRPTDTECILEYLMKKINGQPLPPNSINTVELYAHSPDYLTSIFPSSGDGEWYFFSPREKKYKGGKRPDRAAGDGRWKATSSDYDIFHNGTKIGSRRVLVYMNGKAQNQATKTDWLMHEFKVINSTTTQENSMRLDDWVLCKVYKRGSRRIGNVVNENAPKKKIKSSRKRNKEEEKVEDGEVSIMAEAMQVQPYVENSVATISGPSSSSSDIDAALLPYSCNQKRFCPEFESPYGNMYGETNTGGGLDNAAIDQDAESYNQLSSSSFHLLDMPLPSFSQKMSNFPSDYHHLYGQHGQQGYDQFNVEQHHLPLPLQHPSTCSCQPSYSCSSHNSSLLPRRQEPAFKSGPVNGMQSYSQHHKLIAE